MSTAEQQTVQSQSTKNQQQPPRKKSTYKPQFKWDINSFNQQNALKNLSKLGNQNLQLDNQKKINQKLHVDQFSIKNTILTKQFVYLLRGESQQWGKIQINRKYSDFYLLRQVLVKRWPGVFIPPIPEKGNIGITQKQVNKNKLQIVSTFIQRILQNPALAKSQQLAAFVKSNQNDLQKSLNVFKPHTLQQLYGIYKQAFPQDFQQLSTQKREQYQQKIKTFQDYFSQIKKDLSNHKNQIKKLAQLKTKLTTQRYVVLEKSLPQYQTTCFSWFNNRYNVKKQQKQQKDKQKDKDKQKQQQKKEQNNQEIQQKNQQQQRGYKGIYSSSKYQSALEAYKNDLFPKQQGQNQDWLIYQLFKFQLRQIQSILQAITHYKYLNTQKQYFQRNIQHNKKQLQDISNNKLSLKLLLLSGSEQQKKTQLNNQTQILQNNYKIAQQLWNAVTQHSLTQIQKFQMERCQIYKKSLSKIFKKQAIYMAKLFALCVEIKKI